MTKKKFFRILLLFAVVQAIFSLGIDYTFNIGKHPETGSFTVWHSEHPMTIQDRIMEEFQPDEYFAAKDAELTIYGSESLYNFFAIFFGDKTIYAFTLLRMILIVDLFLLAIIYLTRKSMKLIPSKIQLVVEMMYSFFEGLTVETLGKDKINFTAYILTIFIFIWTCNLIGFIPIPGFMEPTRNINVPLGMGILALAVVHFMSIKHKGIVRYLKDYTEPFLPMAPINLVGEASKGISISFRLFGNILGGAIILLVISSLVRFVILPVGLTMFFGLFIGTLQAFVFTMLAMSYIAVEIFD